ncbi:hypothetical protein AN189_02835 [Loktanella sp. 3ANDIMAR09]|uniref:phage baseplate assembly protein V n=1 Tax=Loktanella sp. 3ANDIMAR09 TaxID=1225657 RepID=UPI0007076041|nr:phage baseplate assembly protein V [Loktanella sp. 3ANDIMAR09]KQI69378.1 hypothetical protein AN189_02835 [Loktanella sp. 3ANDIMAR09]
MPGSTSPGAVNKRGVVVARDPQTQRVRVQFDDEDGIVSAWIDVLAKSTSKTKSFMMPGLGEEVWCALDARGEDGCLLGSKYNARDTPPYASNDDAGIVWATGSVHIDMATGAVTIRTEGTVRIVADTIALESGTLTHNGTNIGDDHTHDGVDPGPGVTGAPT